MRLSFVFAFALFSLGMILLSGCPQGPDTAEPWGGRMPRNFADANRFRDGNFARGFPQGGVPPQMKESLGLPENATPDDVKAALGLPADATQEQLMESLMERGFEPRNREWRSQ
ncbi:MAG: hypothetical protein ABH854_03875 [Candidatus Diapherotrites archaeon]|nr:hypothetical protein [Candidatus Micrarchaeota archaeon]MBU1939655.1 hypothetical protein [Candidatus Micrarchaeota archaeon]